MQKKQVKLMGFQSENFKLKLFYETDGINGRYIVELNRQYQLITDNVELAKKRMLGLINLNLNQLTLNI